MDLFCRQRKQYPTSIFVKCVSCLVKENKIFFDTIEICSLILFECARILHHHYHCPKYISWPSLPCLGEIACSDKANSCCTSFKCYGSFACNFLCKQKRVYLSYLFHSWDFSLCIRSDQMLDLLLIEFELTHDSPRLVGTTDI